ncbi:hypothetical protein ACTXKL_04060 [Brachybacterium tyrofermentans]|uniref:hypothetical protein n=1 Tax=Brachybacterium tyrofermentans TaxID=47848 RepID=UPI003FD10CAB
MTRSTDTADRRRETDPDSEMLEPGKYFARVDSFHPGAIPIATLDIVSAEGWDPHERGATTRAGAVREFWRRWADNASGDTANPFEDFWIRLLEVHLGGASDWERWFNEATWLSITVSRAVPIGDGPIPAGNFEAAVVPPATARALSRLFSMDLWPSATAQTVNDVLASIDSLDHLVVQDVGQGSTNALTGLGDGEGPGIVRLYVDVGAGINRASRPQHLTYCTCSSPLIILTHWHEDHWKGVDLDPSLLKLAWIAPRQPIGGHHATMASRILTAGGSLLIVKRSSRPAVVLGALRQLVHVGYCSGRLTSRNNSGLAVQVQSLDLDRTWLLPGDCDYRFLPPIADPVSALAVTHHGAATTGTPPGRPIGMEYARAVYSFGNPNSYGHPRATAVNAHRSAGWRHSTNPRDLDSLDTRTTAGDGATPRASIAVGWETPPATHGHLRNHHGMSLRT